MHLFNIFFEPALSKASSFYNVDETLTCPQKTIKADDANLQQTDKITTDKQKQEDLGYILLGNNLKINESKTEKTDLERKIKDCLREIDKVR